MVLFCWNKRFSLFFNLIEETHFIIILNINNLLNEYKCNKYYTFRKNEPKIKISLCPGGSHNNKKPTQKKPLTSECHIVNP